MIDLSVRRCAVIEECADRVLAAFNHLWNERASEDGDNAALLAGMTELFNVVYNGLRALASSEKAGPAGISYNPNDARERYMPDEAAVINSLRDIEAMIVGCPDAPISPDGLPQMILAHVRAALAAIGSGAGRDAAIAKDEAYAERNRLVAALAHLFPSGIARTAIPGWEPEWRGCVYVDLPTGQVSWHYHDREAHLFADLPPYHGQWDGHDTATKYDRLRALASAVIAKTCEDRLT